MSTAHKLFSRSCASGVKILLAGYAARHPGSLRRGSCLATLPANEFLTAFSRYSLKKSLFAEGR